MKDFSSHELLPIYVERYLYPSVMDFLVGKRAAHGQGSDLPQLVVDPPQSSTNGFTRDMIRKLKKLPLNGWSRALMDLTSEKPGKAVSFAETCNRAKRGPAHGRAESVGFTKLIRREFDKDRGWPLEWKMVGNRTLYHVTDEIAAWWNEPEQKREASRTLSCHFVRLAGSLGAVGDHIIPRYKGGSNDESNLVSACLCNSRRCHEDQTELPEGSMLGR